MAGRWSAGQAREAEGAARLGYVATDRELQVVGPGQRVAVHLAAQLELEPVAVTVDGEHGDADALAGSVAVYLDGQRALSVLEHERVLEDVPAGLDFERHRVGAGRAAPLALQLGRSRRFAAGCQENHQRCGE